MITVNVSVQFSHSVVSDSLRPHESQHARPPSITNSQSSLRLTSMESVMPSSHLILCCPLLFLPPIPPSMTALESFPMRGLWMCSKTLIPIKPSILKYYLTQWLINCQYMVNYCNLISSSYYCWTSLMAQQERIRLQCRRCRFDPWVGRIPWRSSQVE